ncbi:MULTISPECIES: hypothetical protein [unclassified Sinorhizobium]|uniref:hypothetical protein n=1 Tax=unclassified Sinorhizobium TaxID=2613772 RepID=UPI0035252543
MADTAANIWRDFVVANVPSSGKNEPAKSEIRIWGTWVESILNAIGISAGLIYQTRALLFADLTKAANTMAWVTNDPTVAFNGIYQKVGGTGTGSWTRVADLPYSFITAVDAGAGTPNAIQATSTIPISSSALVLLNIFETNTGSPVTVSFNGGAPLTIKTNNGSDVTVGGLTGGMQTLGIVAGSTFRLVTDLDVSAAVAIAEAAAAAAEASAEEAADYAALARNDKVVKTFTGDGVTATFDLEIDPGSKNNVDLFIGGIYQPIDTFSVSGTSATLSEAPPDSVIVEIKMGYAVPIGTPGDGSVTTAKVAARAVTFPKLPAIASGSLLGRSSAGSGDIEEIPNSTLWNAIAPAGAVVDSKYAEYALNANITATFANSDAVPQISQGTEILSVSITPKSVTNKLRIRFTGNAALSASGHMVFAIFDGAANAIRAGLVSVDQIDHEYTLSGEVEYVPGVTTTKTISVRVGPNGNTMRMNGTSSARRLGGVQVATLVVEEIKA